MSGQMLIFDRRAVRLHRDRATPEAVSGVLAEVAMRLLDRLDDIKRRFTLALDVGGRGVVAPMLLARGIDTISSDLSPALAGAVALDEEFLPFAPASFDLIVANLSLHWINDLPGALIQLRRALRPDGLFLASLPALGTLGELRTALTQAEAALTGGAAPRVSPFPDLRDCASLLQRAGFALPVTDAETLTVRYDSMLPLMRDLRAMGAANALVARSRKFLRRDVLLRAAAIYAERFSDKDGRVRATFELVWLSGWAPHESQARPLKPGSAKMRLADALGVAEIKA